MKRYQLNKKEASNILEDVLERCDLEQNTIPLETLLAYSDYRKERNAFQKRVLIVIMLLFIVLPFFFFTLNMSVSKRESKYLTLYDLKVTNYFPIEKISATIDGNTMAIYETSDQNYVIKAIKNGKMIVRVQLWNKQYKEIAIMVEGCDETPPALISYERNDNLIYIYVSDEQTGIKSDSAYALMEDGSKEKPISSISNCFIFEDKNCEICISDYAGNKLRIQIK